MADVARGTMSPPVEVTATLRAVVSGFEVWLQDGSMVDPADWEEFLEVLGDVVGPRVAAIAGSVRERDGDGRVAVLVSPLLNASPIAVGFFNPCDYFDRDDRPDSPGYNPTSNEKDVLYTGLLDRDDPSFSPRAIAATVAHEYQHLARFSRKTWGSGAARESLSFDEGMSHLVESLCGLGASGGNLAFFARFLDEPHRYSIRFSDSDGSIDSAGKRGATSAFLYWLFLRAGAFAYDASDPSRLVDTGGMSFVRRSIDTDADGWNYLESRFGSSLAELFRGWTTSLLPTGSGVMPVLDPLTGEPAGIVSGIGVVTVAPGRTIEIGYPEAARFGSAVTVARFAACFYPDFDCPGPDRVSIRLDSPCEELLLILRAR